MRRDSPSTVLFVVQGLALMHVLHLVVGDAFFVVPAVIVSVVIAVLGAYSDPAAGPRERSAATSRRLWLAAALAAVLLGPELLERLVLGGPVPRIESA